MGDHACMGGIGDSWPHGIMPEGMLEGVGVGVGDDDASICLDDAPLLIAAVGVGDGVVVEFSGAVIFSRISRSAGLGPAGISMAGADVGDGRGAIA